MMSLAFIDSGAGRPIVWIHGFPLSSGIFEPQLAIPGVRHIVPDLPGFGSSAPPASIERSIDDYARDVAALLAELRVVHATLAGISMGGYVLFAMLRLFPEIASSVVLIDTREKPDSEEGRAARLSQVELVRQEGPRPVIEQMLPKMLTPETAALADWRSQLVRRVMEQASQSGTMAALHAMAGRPDSSETLARLKVPCLVVVGGSDSITPPADAERMSGLTASAELVTIEGAAHLSNVERPAEFNRAVADFLRRHQ